MGRSIRQAARARAVEAQAERRRERAAADKRRSALGVEVAITLGERDELTRRLDLAAGKALVKLTNEEGVAPAELREWVPGLSSAEAKRLRTLALSAVRESSDDVDDCVSEEGAG